LAGESTCEKKKDSSPDSDADASTCTCYPTQEIEATAKLGDEVRRLASAEQQQVTEKELAPS
jgi:hypothetical protein